MDIIYKLHPEMDIIYNYAHVWILNIITRIYNYTHIWILYITTNIMDIIYNYAYMDTQIYIITRMYGYYM